MSRWCRHYAGLARDEKLLAAALAARQTVERVVWLWNEILEDAATRNDGGRFEIDLAGCAWYLHCDVGDLETIKAELISAGRIANGHVCNWGKRQFPSDRSTERVAAFRDRQRKGPHETLPKRRRNSPESELESESEKKISADETFHPHPADQLMPEHIVHHWNELAAKVNKPQVLSLTPSRRQLLKARIGQHPIKDFVSVLDKVERSPFLRGDTGWHGGSFDWVFKRANFQKILEGNYDQ